MQMRQTAQPHQVLCSVLLQHLEHFAVSALHLKEMAVAGDPGSVPLLPLQSSAGIMVMPPDMIFLPRFFRTCHLEVRFEVFTTVTMKNVVFWDVTPRGSCKNRRLGGTYHLHHQGEFSC
jgi:hypothetical protein